MQGGSMKIPLKGYSSLLGIYLRPQWRKVTILAIMVLSGIGLQLLNPQIVRYFIDTALAQGEPSRLLIAAGAFLAAAVLLQIVQVAATYVGEDVGWTATNRLRADLMHH